MKKELFLAVGVCVLVLAVVFSSGCINFGEEEGEGIFKTESLEILDHHMDVETEYNMTKVYVRGTAKNIGNEELWYASVSVKFYDADGTLLSTDIDGVGELDAGESWNFKVKYLGDEPAENVASYTISVGTCY